ncbi:uncharacterized protein Triagg1_3326 [Trichoderma aggressivum f. europaeum]|uniref:Peptidase C14 caspase domain-containing protein n=1 Tax=Trichoderma aggressivum f. europaeum TaxID=173218 RepID=A0AAE1M0Q5_9HYPO|nr:hypothetical protein Triagg1_3326 [Trichoderma aggressivum f. europaeum]
MLGINRKALPFTFILQASPLRAAMADKSRLDRVYAKLLSNHPYGWALYKKVTTQDMHPGSCGYFDSDGDWHTIVDLRSPDDLTTHGWALPDDRINEIRAPGSTRWGPKSSKSVQTICIGGTAKAAAMASTLETSLTVSFKSNSDQGAVLTTTDPVTRHQLGDELSALQWMADNTSKMIHQHKDIVKRHGIWIITKTYSTRSCAIAIMSSESSSIDITLDNMQGILALTPKSAWSRSSGNSCTEIHEDVDGVVVFISGIYFSQKRWRSKLGQARDQRQQKDKLYRGDESETGDGESNELDVEYYPPIDEDDDEEADEQEDEFAKIMPNSKYGCLILRFITQSLDKAQSAINQQIPKKISARFIYHRFWEINSKVSEQNMSKKFALLVGIDLYLSDGSRKGSDNLHHLRGCTNDVKAINEFLNDKYKFDEITTLTSSFPDSDTNNTAPIESSDHLPTFVNIKAKFAAIYDRAVSGDLFYFHYSGHGKLLPRQADSPKSNTLEDPSLITVDFCCGQPAIRGWQLNQWLRKLNNKGIRLLVTLDSCYSEGSWRSSGDYVSLRTPKDWFPVPNLPADDQAAANSGQNAEPTYRDAELGKSWSINPESFTILVACGSKEMAAEKIIDGKIHGAFTWELLDYLKDNESEGTNVTYRMISDQLNMRLKDQTPKVYGRDRLIFLENSEPFSALSKVFLVVQLQGNKVVVPAGKAHGVNVGSEFMLSPRTQSSLFSVDEGYRHTVTLSRWHLGKDSFQVYVDPAFGSDFRSKLQKRLEERIISPIEILVSINNRTDVLRLEKWEGDVAKICGPAWLIGSDDPVRPLDLEKDNFSELATEAALALAHLARFWQILLLKTQSSSKPALFNVSIKPVNGDTTAGVYPIHQKFRYTLENESDEQLHVTVVVFSPEFSIEQLYPPRDDPQTIDPGKRKTFSFSMTLPNGPQWVQESLCRTSRRDIVRTLVTKGGRISWKSLELPNIWDAGEVGLPKLPSHTRGGFSRLQIEADWWSHDEEIFTGSADNTCV